MSKVIQIYGCKGCPRAPYGYCNLADRLENEIPSEGIPDWCPLPDMPEYATSENCVYDDYWLYGWNAAIDAIKGEKRR